MLYRRTSLNSSWESNAVVYLTLGALLARIHSRRSVKIYILALAILVTVAIDVSRVYMGVHWPTDVLAGWSAGAVWSVLCWLAAVWLQHRNAVVELRTSGDAD